MKIFNMKIFHYDMEIFHFNMKYFTSTVFHFNSISLQHENISPGAVGDKDKVGVLPARARHLEYALAVGLAARPVRGTHQVLVTSTYRVI